ncbi:MAG: ribose 5-phosphate isomerase B [Alphaproteobacteria bacterium]|nr:ribose 5-phosphate isomerase B [Alphaproteobacteria bacterium]
MSFFFLASDHAGFDLKQQLVEFLRAQGHTAEDLGCHSADSVDYPDYGHKLAEAMLRKPGNQGIAICGSGIGISIAANRHPHIRAALCRDVESATLSRQHNDANVLALGARFTDQALAEAMLKAFIETPFEGGRHERRIAKLNAVPAC